MKKFQCELCNSLEIVKVENNVFQCQHCGCKYSAEQAKSLITEEVEMTKRDIELRRLIANVESQVKLNQDSAFSTIDKIIYEYPNNYIGYWLYIKATIHIVLKNKNINLGYRPYVCHNGKVSSISLTCCKEMYLTLLKLTDNNTELTKQQVIDYWESIFNMIYNGLITGEITGLCSIFNQSEIEAHPLLIKAYSEGKENCYMLRQKGIYVYIEPTNEFGKKDFVGFADIEQCTFPYFILGKEVHFNDNIAVLPQEYIPINRHVDEIVRLLDVRYNRCPCCHVRLIIPFLSKHLKCPNCGKVYFGNNGSKCKNNNETITEKLDRFFDNILGFFFNKKK